MLLLWSKGTADMTKDLCGSLTQRLKMLLHIREEQFKRAAVMIMRHDPSRDAPKPFDAVGIRIISGSVHQIQLVLKFTEQAPHKQGASGRVGLEIVSDHDGQPSPLL